MRHGDQRFGFSLIQSQLSPRRAKDRAQGEYKRVLILRWPHILCAVGPWSCSDDLEGSWSDIADITSVEL